METITESKPMTIKEAVRLAYWEMNEIFNLYEEFFPAVRAKKFASESSITAMMRENRKTGLKYRILNSKEGIYQRY